MLPEDHGIIFPGGYYLESGDHKVFEQDLQFIREGEAVVELGSKEQ